MINFLSESIILIFFTPLFYKNKEVWQFIFPTQISEQMDIYSS